MQDRDEANIDISIPLLNVPADIEMDILYVVLLNADPAEGEESDIGSHTMVLDDEELNPDTKDEVTHDSMELY